MVEFSCLQRNSYISGFGAYPFCGLAAVAAAVLRGGAAAQSSSSSCTSELISMSPCLNYITGSSSEPSSSCCQKLASVVKSQPQCLCAALNGVGCQWGSMSTKIRLWPFMLLAVLRLLPLAVAVIFKMNSYINPFFGANHRGGNG